MMPVISWNDAEYFGSAVCDESLQFFSAVSRRGSDCVLSGATRVFAAIRVTYMLPSGRVTLL